MKPKHLIKKDEFDRISGECMALLKENLKLIKEIKAANKMVDADQQGQDCD